MNQELHDSGKRRTFPSGAQRDRGDLKPRPDLISPHAQMREGIILALGAEKYGPRNYEKGMPISECYASTQRHIEQAKRGDTDEDHLAQARTNLGFIIHYEEEIRAGRMDPVIDDMPKYAQLAPLDHRLPSHEMVIDPATPGVEKTVTGVCGFASEDGSISVGGLIHELGMYDSPTKERIKITAGPRSNRKICTYCGASIPPLPGEGVCIRCPITIMTPQEPPTFYITGPMRGCHLFNFPAFDEARDRAHEAGFRVISPADLDREHGIDPIKDPGSFDRVSKDDPNIVQTIVQRDISAILNLDVDRGDGLILLPGWAASTGARAEVGVALFMGLCFRRARALRVVMLTSEVKEVLYGNGAG